MLRHRLRLASVLLCLWLAMAMRTSAADFAPPQQVKVLPIFLVPVGAKAPTPLERDVFVRHLQWTQQWYKKSLKNRDTFEIARLKPEVVALPKPLAFYRDESNGDKAMLWTAHLLNHFNVSRFTCEWIFCCVIMNPADNWPAGGAGPINGGFNRGGGYVEMSSYNLDRPDNFQGTLRHEIGHAFGLKHVDTYGYDQRSGNSVMSYNQDHRTKGFIESKTPAKLIPEDVRGLAFNHMVFSKLKFDRTSDVATDYELKPAVAFPPMILPGHPDFEPQLSTTSGEDLGSKVGNVFHEILPNAGPGTTFRASRMWLSLPPKDGWVTVSVTFPIPVKLSGMTVHSQHSGRWNAATAIRLEAQGSPNDSWNEVAHVEQAEPVQALTFAPVESAHWQIKMQASKLKNEWQKVCLRGLQFFAGPQHDIELFPPRLPFNGDTSP